MGRRGILFGSIRILTSQPCRFVSYSHFHIPVMGSVILCVVSHTPRSTCTKHIRCTCISHLIVLMWSTTVFQDNLRSSGTLHENFLSSRRPCNMFMNHILYHTGNVSPLHPLPAYQAPSQIFRLEDFIRDPSVFPLPIPSLVIIIPQNDSLCSSVFPNDNMRELGCVS